MTIGKVKFFVLFLASNLIFTNCYTQLNTIPKDTQNYNYSSEISGNTKYDIEIRARFFLSEKYHPGACFGMPGPTDERLITSFIKDNPSLVKIIEDVYHIRDEKEAYKIIRSLKSFAFEKSNEGYRFSFTDGNCCIITSYKGILYLKNDKIIKSEIISTKSKNIPC